MLMVVIAVAIMIASVGMGAASAENFLGQGFDKCEIPTLSQMQNWITNSPYRAVNLYIGGSVRSCTNSALTASYVSQLSQQGWKFIPTWVGPQSAGWSGSSGSRISNDPATAYNEGINEANAAINVAINLGLALADGSGTIIYYDIENYDTTNTVYRNAAKSFISGWTAQLHARGSKAGVYGSSCGSGINDFASISNVPDAIWPANWFTPYQYRSDATVWDVACLSNGIWGNHQRIRQYAGGHSETWGGVTLNIDSNVIDGIVASSLPTISEKSLLRVDTQIEVYWLQNGKLYWITDWEIINQMSGIPGWAGDSVNILPVSVFNPATYPQGPRFITSTSEGMLIQENGAIDVYLISGGMRHYITYELFVSRGYDFADVIIVSPQIMNAITKGSDISTPPNTPITPAPSNGATNQPTTPTLSWTGGDPDGDSVIYTVYLSTSSNPTTQKCSGTSTSCSVSGLSYSTKYYWNVVASDGKSSPVTGPVWSFTTTTPSPIIGTWKVIGTIPLTGIKMPLHIAINQGKAYVGRNPAQLTVIDLATNTTNDILITPYSGATPGYIAFSGNKAYVTLSNLGSSGQVAVVNINDNTISAYIPVGVDPWGATTFNNKLYITNNVWWNDNSPATVKVINIDTNSIFASIPVGINPTSIAVDPVTRKAYVTNHNDLSKSLSEKSGCSECYPCTCEV